MTLVDLAHLVTWIGLVVLVALVFGAVWAVIGWGMDRYISRPLRATRSEER